MEHRASPNVVAGSTPVLFRGRQPSARVVTVGINPSIREFLSRNGADSDGACRRFETLASLGVNSMADITEAMADRIRQRCLGYFENNPYMDWFAPMEAIVTGITGASFFNGSAYHLDLVHWVTDPLWGQLQSSVQQELFARDRPEVIRQLGNTTLETIYLNGKTVCEEVGGFIPLINRTAQFRGQGSRRRFHRGWHGNTMVVGCSSNIQEERLKADDRDDFMRWIISECRSDLDALKGAPERAGPALNSSPDTHEQRQTTLR